MQPPLSILDYSNAPAAGKNNFWLHYRNSDRCLIFVHGIFSDSRGCWLSEQTATRQPSYWPEMIAGDPQFGKYSIYLGGYPTGPTTTGYSMFRCGQYLWDELNRTPVGGAQSPLAHRNLIFVCHSMGGIIVRHLLERHWRSLQDKNIGLLLMASPSRGSLYANIGGIVAGALQHDQGLDLREGSAFLEYVHDRFRRVLDEKRVPNLYGREASENYSMHRGFRPIVNRASAETYFDDPIMIAGSNHSTCVKPETVEDQTYKLLSAFAANFEQRFQLAGSIQRPKPQAAPSAVATAAFAADSLHWEAAFDEDGDAKNKHQYRGIRPADPNQPVELFVSRTLAGHFAEPELSQKPSLTSPGLRLETKPKTIQESSVFLYTDGQTEVDACITQNDFNVFCVNKREFLLKSSYDDSGIDYIEKTINSDLGHLTLTVRFPEKMELPSDPRPTVYPIGSPGNIDVPLTKLCEDPAAFEYSSTTKVARLRVEKPRRGYVYRISWTLPEGPNSELMQDSARNRLWEFNTPFLLGMEPAIARAQTAIAKVPAVLGSLIQQHGRIHKPPSFAALDVTLLLLDLDGAIPVLRYVSGLRPRSNPQQPAIAFEIGDGTAGRAYKKRAVCVYNGRGESKENVYLTVPGLPRHSHLLAIPMIGASDNIACGVLNIGAFDRQDAYWLTTLKSTAAINDLAALASSMLELLSEDAPVTEPLTSTPQVEATTRETSKGMTHYSLAAAAAGEQTQQRYSEILARLKS